MIGFNSEKFNATQFHARTRVVDVPELAEYFADGAPPVFTVRGLTGSELASARDAVRLNMAASDAVSASSGADDKVKWALNFLMTLTGGSESLNVTSEYALRLSMVSLGASLDQATVVRIGRNFPIVFGALAHAIDDLTGMGAATEGELNASGAIPG